MKLPFRSKFPAFFYSLSIAAFLLFCLFLHYKVNEKNKKERKNIANGATSLLIEIN